MADEVTGSALASLAAHLAELKNECSRWEQESAGNDAVMAVLHRLGLMRGELAVIEAEVRHRGGLWIAWR